MSKNSNFVFGRIPKTLSLKDMDATTKAFQKLQTDFNALPEPIKKEMYDMLFEHTEKIIESMQKKD